jgi:hypothetical protein
LILVSGAIQPPNLQAIPLLVLTENSSTSLTATLDGTSLVMNQFNDFGYVDFSAGELLGPGFGTYQWKDPEGFWNLVVPTASSQFYVHSDTPFSPFPFFDNGSLQTIHNGLSSGGGIQDLNVVFTDNGDVAAVPEPSTLSYIVLTALVSVMVLMRKLTGGFSHSGTGSYKGASTL